MRSMLLFMVKVRNMSSASLDQMVRIRKKFWNGHCQGEAFNIIPKEKVDDTMLQGRLVLMRFRMDERQWESPKRSGFRGVRERPKLRWRRVESCGEVGHLRDHSGRSWFFWRMKNYPLSSLCFFLLCVRVIFSGFVQGCSLGCWLGVLMHVLTWSCDIWGVVVDVDW